MIVMSNSNYSGRYNSFGPYIKKKFGTTVYKVNVDAGFTCPNRDGTLGTNGCIYCNNESFRPSSCSPGLPVSQQIRNGIAYLGRRYHAEKFLVYFQPFTNTYAPLEMLEKIYEEALKEPLVIGLAIGTRADCIDNEKLNLLETLAEKHFILVEYGLQSVYNRTLAFIQRGHDYQAFLDAIKLTSQRKAILVGVHLIAGFPTENRAEMLAMAEEVSGLEIDFLKIHQLQVIKNTVLETLFREAPFHVFEYDEYLDFLVDFIERLSPRIILQRLFATAPDSILVAPQWGRTRQQILKDIENRFIERDACQGSKFMLVEKTV